MKKIFLCLILIFVINRAFAGSTHFVRQNSYINNPYYRNYNYYQHKILPRDLSALEKYSMNKSYPRESSLQRLERLENLAFGSIQNGNIKSRYRNVESAILSRPKSVTKRNAMGALTNYFIGQTTGITPSVHDSFDNFMPAYDNFIHNGNGITNSRINQYSNGIWGHGYSIYNNNAGNGASVRILD